MGRTVELRTEIPGPNSRAIVARKERVVAAAKTLVAPVVIDRGAGCTVTDVDGNTFLDWSGGIGCLNVGHTNPRVTAALHTQIDRFLHTDFTILPYESYVELAERLVERTPISGPKKAAFFNSGAEAVENAVKIARHATGRQAVIAFEGAFHGRTLMAMSLTSKQHPYKAGMGPFAPEVYRAPFPNPYRWPGSDPAAGGARRPAADADDARRRRERRRDRLRTRPGRGRVHRPAGGVGAGPARTGVEARDRARRRRGAVRVRPHRQALRHRALRHRARPHRGGQVDRRRRAALRGRRPSGHRRRRARQLDRRDVRRIPARMRCRARGDRGARGRAARSRGCDRRADRGLGSRS